ncbi:SDR family oxidoreductase [Devosia sp. ZW T5_3]|uniref:SDR family oxidoreductase n=1 Tax=Devosia sp. ZW T5_3 TaxID=3378085 RepID=UPI00385318F4
MSDDDTSRRTFLALTAAAPAALALGGVAFAQTSETGPGALPASGRAAVITGSSRGIGAATARRLAKDGYAVTVNYLTNADLAAQVVADIEAAGGRAIARQADVADPAAVKALFDANDEAFGGVDVVVNNAGIMNLAPFAEMTDEAFDRMMATNVKGSFNVLREAARRTRDGGRIVSLSSGAAAQRPAAYGPYAATKVVQEAYSGSLAKELGRRGIAVVPIAPGAVNTTLFTGGRSQEFVQGIINQTPFQRLAEPQDIANAIAALCTSDLHWINTGQPIHANGGLG